MTSPIQAGDKVRSYDFEGRDDYYVEGVVLAIVPGPDCSHYRIKVDKLVESGKEVEFFSNYYVHPPVNGTPTLLGRITSGVARISRS